MQEAGIEQVSPRTVVLGGTPMIREAVASVCAERLGFSVVARTGDPAEAADQARRARADVGIVDLGRPRVGGLEMVSNLVRAHPPIRILVLNDELEAPAESCLASLAAGAMGCLRRSASITEVADAISAVATGRPTIDGEQRRNAVRDLRKMADAARRTAESRASLTRREREVLEMIAQGMTAAQAASALRVSPRTVNTHVSHVYRKLRVGSRVQAMRRAVELGLVDVHRERSVPDAPGTAP